MSVSYSLGLRVSGSSCMCVVFSFISWLIESSVLVLHVPARALEVNGVPSPPNPQQWWCGAKHQDKSQTLSDKRENERKKGLGKRVTEKERKRGRRVNEREKERNKGRERERDRQTDRQSKAETEEEKQRRKNEHHRRSERTREDFHEGQALWMPHTMQCTQTRWHTSNTVSHMSVVSLENNFKGANWVFLCRHSGKLQTYSCKYMGWYIHLSTTEYLLVIMISYIFDLHQFILLGAFSFALFLYLHIYWVTGLWNWKYKCLLF